MKIYLDDERVAPFGFTLMKTVEDAKRFIKRCEYNRKITNRSFWDIEEISLDNDLGEDQEEGYKLLDWLEETGRNYHCTVHSMNPVAVERMRMIIDKNGW